MLKKSKSIFIDKNLNKFSSQTCEALESAFSNFWEQDIKIILQAINDFREIREEKLVANLDFYTSQIKIENHKPIVVRLSKEFVDNILRSTLNANSNYFRFSDITPLEIKILNGFCEFMHKKLKDILIPTKDAKLSEKSEKKINLLFRACFKNKKCPKFMISIPQDRINFETLEKNPSFKEEDFINSKTTVKLRVGNSKITFDELQNLAADDIILLENSELSKMTLISGEISNKFNVKVNSALIVNINTEEEDRDGNIQVYDEVKMEKNLWDDIQIEINAEFEKVKMTIGELKQITQGQIVDLGSILENEISLFVEDRKVAKGELIIINDRYAVRLNEILSTNTQKAPIDAKVSVGPKPATTAAKPSAAPPARPTAAKPAATPSRPATAKPATAPAKSTQAQSGENEEFDYSDFEK